MRVPLHIVEARRERLRELVRRDGFLPLADICRVFEISEATARRDLAAIEADGHITRTYGGALADYNSSFASLGERTKRARSAKSRIARAAIKLVPLSGTIFLDAGTTTLALARLLTRRKNHSITVVTNSLAVASVLGGAPGISLHLLGGIFLNRQATLFGDHAVSALSGWKIDAAFLGAEAINTEGVWNSHEEVVRLQRAVLEKAARTYLCIDATKLNRSTPHCVAHWEENFRLVSDSTDEQLRAAGIALPEGRLINPVG
ncbi:MAG: DeoR/GlpR family DNA-binding transcription regulator [Nibricoccus sp.]